MDEVHIDEGEMDERGSVQRHFLNRFTWEPRSFSSKLLLVIGHIVSYGLG